MRLDVAPEHHRNISKRRGALGSQISSPRQTRASGHLASVESRCLHPSRSRNGAILGPRGGFLWLSMGSAAFQNCQHPSCCPGPPTTQPASRPPTHTRARTLTGTRKRLTGARPNSYMQVGLSKMASQIQNTLVTLKTADLMVFTSSAMSPPNSKQGCSKLESLTVTVRLRPPPASTVGLMVRHQGGKVGQQGRHICTWRKRPRLKPRWLVPSNWNLPKLHASAVSLSFLSPLPLPLGIFWSQGPGWLCVNSSKTGIPGSR